MEGTRFSEDELETLSMHAPKTLRCIRSHTTPLSYWLVKCCPWVTGVLLGSDLDEFIEEEGHSELYSDNLIEIQWFGSMEHLLKMVTGETNYILDENEMQPHSIQILGLRDALHPDWRRGTDVLQSVGRSLRSLHLAQCDFEYATCIRDHVRNLEELILDVLPAEQLLDALPTTIQHLQITTPNNVVCTSDVDLRHLRHWISVTQSLKVLTWTTQGCSGHGRYEWIDAACKKVGAELHLYRGPFGSFPGEQDELASGPVKSFPRTLVFSPARTNGFKLCYNVEQFVGTIADHHTTKAVEVPNDRPKNPSRCDTHHCAYIDLFGIYSLARSHVA
ncbi:hypothetical protein FRC02_008996 [Tulasnella sp. 418]|nr:hypothetical protein FRC02_008996 [Tulasnella sp. 418]